MNFLQKGVFLGLNFQHILRSKMSDHHNCDVSALKAVLKRNPMTPLRDLGSHHQRNQPQHYKKILLAQKLCIYHKQAFKIKFPDPNSNIGYILVVLTNGLEKTNLPSGKLSDTMFFGIFVCMIFSLLIIVRWFHCKPCRPRPWIGYLRITDRDCSNVEWIERKEFQQESVCNGIKPPTTLWETFHKRVLEKELFRRIKFVKEVISNTNFSFWASNMVCAALVDWRHGLSFSKHKLTLGWKSQRPTNWKLGFYILK